MEHFLDSVVHKYVSKYPQPGTVLKECDSTSSCDAFTNKGGLKIMNPHYRSAFLDLENIFQWYHGASLREGDKAIQNVLQLCIPSDIPKEVTPYYVRCRIYFRKKELITTLNVNLYSGKISRKIMKIMQ